MHRSETNPISLFHGRRLVVLGDVMLDRFIYGHVRRISPEAPVPVLLKEKELAMPGGAGNVARNIAALGGTAILIGVIGDDAAGRDLRQSLRMSAGIEDLTLALEGTATIEKIRFYAQQHLLRVDAEVPADTHQESVLPRLESALARADALILSDYAKGLLSAALVRAAITAARRKHLPVIVDPKARDLSRYNGASLLTPNAGEAEISTGIEIVDDAAADRAGNMILQNLPDTPAVIITRGDKGVTLVERQAAGGTQSLHLRTQAREVYDVSGAGDTLVSVLGLGIAAKLDLATSMRLANLAAGIVVGKHGTATVDAEDLDRAVRQERRYPSNPASRKAGGH